jgi:predicted amidohydrolase YtcJ
VVRVHADLILTGGRIHASVGKPAATAIAVHDGRVATVGGDELRDLAGPGTEQFDLRGRTVIPGLIDAHNHLLHTGQVLSQVQLFDCRSIGEIVERVRARAAELPSGTWLLGRGWDESLLAERRHPTRHDLDPVSPDHPVVLERVWNQLVCNSRALAAAGITRDTPDPPAGEVYAGGFERDPHGHPTGHFRDRAKDLVRRAIPAPDEPALVDAIATACRAYNALGLTTVAEPGLWPAETRAFAEAERTGRLTVRTDLMLGAWGWGDSADDARVRGRLEVTGTPTGVGSDLLRVGGVKILPDGGIGDRTARVFEPYLDDSANRGTWVVDPAELPECVRFAHDRGWAIDTHTCGDEAQAVTVRAYAAAQEANPKPWLRHRVHHAYFPTAETLATMARHRITAVTSNPFLVYLAESFVTSIGENRARRAMPMRTYLDAGVPLAGSSDTPVSDHNPWTGIWAACTRRTELGRELDAAERLTPLEALQSYTSGGAWAIGREHDLGGLEPGMLADMVILDADPLGIPVDDLRHLVPATTMLGGRIVAGSL